jgi:hypothetical protein
MPTMVISATWSCPPHVTSSNLLVPTPPKVTKIDLLLINIVFGGTSFCNHFEPFEKKNTCKIDLTRLTYIRKKLVRFLFHKFERQFTYICSKILQICVKLCKSSLVGPWSPWSQHLSQLYCDFFDMASNPFSCISRSAEDLSSRRVVQGIKIMVGISRTQLIYFWRGFCIEILLYVVSLECWKKEIFFSLSPTYYVYARKNLFPCSKLPCSKLPCSGWRWANFLQGVFSRTMSAGPTQTYLL